MVEVSTMMTDVDSELLKILFPPKEVVLKEPVVQYATNNVIQKTGVLYAKPGSGKTEFTRRLAEEAEKVYGQGNVNLVYCQAYPGCVTDLLKRGSLPVLVNIYFIDDITGVKLTAEDFTNYFRIRHIFQKVTGASNGLLIMIAATHRFHEAPKAFRNKVGFLLAKDAPSGGYDETIIRDWIGKKGIRFLDEIDPQKDQDPTLKGWVYWSTGTRTMSKRGSAYFPLATRDSMQEIAPMDVPGQKAIPVDVDAIFTGTQLLTTIITRLLLGFSFFMTGILVGVPIDYWIGIPLWIAGGLLILSFLPRNPYLILTGTGFLLVSLG